MTDLDHRIEITWRRGAYYLSVPNYQGGTVYTKEYVDGLLSQLASKTKILNRYRRALVSIAANTCCEHCQETALVAQSALADEKSP